MEDKKIENQEEEIESGIVPSLKDTEISDLVKNSFIDYAMSVIVARALPESKDGLKPVQRRIIYAMNEAGYTPAKPYVKCAKIVGDVMGKYHPHGDSSIYMALVYMAQNFSLRYTLIDGHGNFGTMDGDDPAAYRYTEARLNKLSLELVRDINLDTIDYMPNYDGTLDEPLVLPSRFPNLLVNGSEGIAVGMATKMPPHNLKEVTKGIIHFIHNPEITIDELMNDIKGPDFPTGGIVYGLSGIKDAYETGRGSFKLRAKTEIQEMPNGKSKIIVSEIPYQVNKSDLVKKIGELARDKKIDGITSIKDYSKIDVHIEIETRADVNASVLLNQLFKNTKLEVSYGIINLSIVNGVPKVLGLKALISNYVDYQVEVIRRRTECLLKKDEARIHIINGFLMCHDNIDEIVEMSKNSESPEDFVHNLQISRFKFSEPQARAIAALTLGRLTKLETNKLIDERNKLEENIKNYNYILESREHILEVVETELNEIADKFGDERRSQISSSLSSIDDEDLIPKQEIVITLTEKGYVKRMAVEEFKSQNRGGKGIKGLTTYNDDEISKLIYASTHTDIFLFSSKGRVYRKRGHQIPEATRTAKGTHMANLLSLQEDEKIVSIIPVDEYENKFLFFATKHGICKRTSLNEFIRINQNGKFAITFKEDDELLDVKITDGNATILLATKSGLLSKFNENQVREMGRTASGVKGMNVDGSELISIATSLEGSNVFVISEKGLGKQTSIDDYRETNRGAKGVRTIKITEKTGNLVAMKVVNGDEDYLVTTNKGIIVRTPLSQVRNCGRNSQGVILISFKNDDEYVQSCTILPHKEENEEVNPQEIESSKEEIKE